MSVDWGNSTVSPELSPHHCGKCGSWHQGYLCPHERQPAPTITVHPILPVSEWQRCPVCEGRGSVPCGFYTGPAQTGTAPEECRGCHGAGMVTRPTHPVMTVE